MYGIEIVEPAIKDANENAKANNIANAEFICGDAAVEMPALLKSGVKPDTVLLDLRAQAVIKRFWRPLPE